LVTAAISSTTLNPNRFWILSFLYTWWSSYTRRVIGWYYQIPCNGRLREDQQSGQAPSL